MTYPVSMNTHARLLIICGLSFSGKTTLAKAIIEQFGYTEVDVDDTKTALFGSDIRDEYLLREDWVRIYTETDRQIEEHLKLGKPVVDASRYFAKVERNAAQRIAAQAGAPLITVYVDTPEEVARRRLLENRQNPARRNVTDSDFEDVLRVFEPPGSDEHPILYHFEDELKAWINKNRTILDVS